MDCCFKLVIAGVTLSVGSQCHAWSDIHKYSGHLLRLHIVNPQNRQEQS
jgi:hypothetical protein